ncbi:NADPH-dependent FMN reductase [Shimia aestuarii]|uniref:NAD(P)H-dependent FMN reductase n=1 Tax=Shimia aestuarii TaxID=254406 RepID=A0A1I4T952_9RHOB|nr:NAD(P)H-dependent oxidoreductase [Shimia aestuarii]SFM73239.1 NAD(P)H-dependent FMN reductase [Shimia aestuarii]
MKLFGVAASTRENSLNRHLFDRVAAQIEEHGHQITVADYTIVENLPLYTAAREIDPGIPDEVQTMARAILDADALVISSPEYNFSIPGPLKNALDWISRIKPSVLTGKPVLLLAASASPVGGWRGLAALRVPLTCLGAQALPWEITLGGVTSRDAIDASLALEVTRQRVDMAISALLRDHV